MRWVLRAAALAAAGLVVLYSLLLARGDSRVGLAGVAALVVVTFSLLVRLEGAVTLGAALLVGVYVVALLVADVAMDGFVPIVAALLVAYLELSDLAVALPGRRRVDGRFLRVSFRRAARPVTLAVLVSAGVVVAALVPLPGSTAVRAAGILAGAAAVAVPVALLARRP